MIIDMIHDAGYTMQEKSKTILGKKTVQIALHVPLIRVSGGKA